MRKFTLILLLVCIGLIGLNSCKKDGQVIENVFDGEGHPYRIVHIGTQTWMLENIRATKYADSTAMVNGKLAGDINLHGLDLTTKYWFTYKNDTMWLADYGCYYTRAAVMNGAKSSNASPSGVQGPCPNGWHVPSKAEWQTLVDYAGGEAAAGGNLKGYWNWLGGNVGAGTDNATGFNAMPAGWRQGSSVWQFFEANAYYWSSTYDENDSTRQHIIWLSTTTAASVDTTIRGDVAVSCRCMQD